MKKNLFLFILITLSFFLISSTNTVTLININIDGSENLLSYPADTKEFIFYNADSKPYKTTKIKGLEKLKELEVLRFYMLPFVEDYSFLKDVSKTCKELTLDGCQFYGFENISHLTNLEEIFISGSHWTDEQYNALVKTGIDLSCFPKLKSFSIQVSVGDDPRACYCSAIEIKHTKKMKREFGKVTFYDE